MEGRTQDKGGLADRKKKVEGPKKSGCARPSRVGKRREENKGGKEKTETRERNRSEVI